MYKEVFKLRPMKRFEQPRQANQYFKNIDVSYLIFYSQQNKNRLMTTFLVVYFSSQRPTITITQD